MSVSFVRNLRRHSSCVTDCRKRSRTYTSGAFVLSQSLFSSQFVLVCNFIPNVRIVFVFAFFVNPTKSQMCHV